MHNTDFHRSLKIIANATVPISYLSAIITNYIFVSDCMLENCELFTL